jgi:outer membrane lipoprotein-sorting protein
MRSNDSLKDMLRQLRYQATPGQRQRTLENIFHVTDETHEPTPAWGRMGIGRRIMNPRVTKVALAAAVILIVLGSISFWPSSNRSNQWWLGSPAAWGQQITRSLEKVNVLMYREGAIFVGDYGSTHISGNWSRWYKAPGRQRKDTYYNDTLVGTMWELPDGAGATMRWDVSYEFQCYTKQTYPHTLPTSDLVSSLRFYVDLLGKADRVLDANSFEDKDCVGFEISAAKYGSNPKEWIDRIWFDKKTSLPVRIEQHGRPVTNHPEETLTFVQNEFQYASAVPTDIFEPRIPEGFVNEHPDTIRKAREREKKGEMTFAAVPAGLKDSVFTAFRQARTVAYTEAGTRFYVSRDAWRMDRRDGDRIRETEWHVIQKDDNAPTSLDFNDKNYRRVQTTVDYDARTYRQIEHRQSPWMSHPLDRLGFTIGLIDRADRFYESAPVDGVACFGFDVSAKKYGTNPDGAFHRVWFDQATNLPVRMETHWPSSDGTGETVTVREQFEWDPVLPEDFFIAQIPPGFTRVEE